MAQTDVPWVLDRGQITRLIHPHSIRNNISALSIATSSTPADKTTDCSGDPERQMASFSCDHSAESWGGRPRDGTRLLDTWAAIFQPPEPPCPSPVLLPQALSSSPRHCLLLSPQPEMDAAQGAGLPAAVGQGVGASGRQLLASWYHHQAGLSGPQ